jgi:phospholipase C
MFSISRLGTVAGGAAFTVAYLVLAGCSAAGGFDGSGPFDERARFGAPSFASAPYDDHLVDRAQCNVFGTGATTTATIGSSAPDASPVEHVVVVMLENRSFDHLLSDLPAVGVTNLGSQVSPTVTNPDGRSGSRLGRTVATDYCIPNTVRHEWGDVHLQLNAGRMDGFVAASDGHAMEYYSHDDLPILYGLAKTFAMSDRHFSPILGPTWPNRLFMFAATSCGFAEGFDSNPEVTFECGVTAPNIVKAIKDANHTVAFYDESGVASVAAGLGIWFTPRRIAQFRADAASGSLPDVSFVGASTGKLLAPVENDDHPPANVLLGEKFLYDVYSALTANPAVWAKSILFVTFDEHGGFYDHVRPPPACDPMGPNAMLRDYRFDQFGFRVPLLVISPFARRSYVTHADTDHTSITRFIEHWLKLGALTSRDANAWPFLDVFDFKTPVFDAPVFAAPAANPPCDRAH